MAIDPSSYPKLGAADIALARRTGNGLDRHSPIGSKEALKHHMHVFSDSAGIGIPARNQMDKWKRHRVDCSWEGDAMSAGLVLEARQACSAPHEVSDANHNRYMVCIAVEDDRGHIHGHVDRVASLSIVGMPPEDNSEIIAEEVSVTCIKTRL